MNSALDNEALSGDLRHENDLEVIEDVNAFYGEDENDYGEEIEDEDKFTYRADDDRKSQATDLQKYSRACLFDYVYVGREHEEEEEETPVDFDDDTYSAVKYEQASFHEQPLSEEERQDIIHRLKDLFSEANVSMVVNRFLQKAYIDMNRKSPSMANALDKSLDEALVFEDPRYLAALENFGQTRDYVDGTRTSLTAELEGIESSCIVAESTYSGTFENLLSSQLAVAKKTKPPKYDKDTWLAEVERQLDNQRQRASEVAKIRLAHVHLQGKLAKMMDRLKQFDSLGPGFSMMDYEYLVKRKSIYSERRDEQRENIKKLKEKNLASAAMSRHIAEETDLYNENVSKDMDNLVAFVNGNKGERSKAVKLGKTKVSISKNMTKLKEEIGLFNYPFLLRKMERDLREIAKLKRRADGVQAKMTADTEKISKCNQSSI